MGFDNKTLQPETVRQGLPKADIFHLFRRQIKHRPARTANQMVVRRVVRLQAQRAMMQAHLTNEAVVEKSLILRYTVPRETLGMSRLTRS